VTAATASGGTAQQSWTVTPGGTITVNWINNYWTATGSSGNFMQRCRFRQTLRWQ
jgi:hypothetical protein